MKIWKSTNFIFLFSYLPADSLNPYSHDRTTTQKRMWTWIRARHLLAVGRRCSSLHHRANQGWILIKSTLFSNEHVFGDCGKELLPFLLAETWIRTRLWRVGSGHLPRQVGGDVIWEVRVRLRPHSSSTELEESFPWYFLRRLLGVLWRFQVLRVFLQLESLLSRSSCICKSPTLRPEAF